MKYTKSIAGFMFLNLILIFLMIFVANNTREIEKKNDIYKNKILNINQNIKINKIELSLHQNISYLTKIHSLYFPKIKKNNTPNIISLNQLSNKIRNVKLVTNIKE
tara:strand:- start:148 stop:465 length:318 start_codon:yes stop_codon:yes gene_type:complete